MSIYKLKSIAQRGTMLGAAVALLAAAVLPAVPAYADALNPLTDRSLALSSSSPGWSNTDGSENATYAPPNSGANGEKTGNTFSFKTSTPTSIKAFTFQYCTNPAGTCTNPGNDATPGADLFGSQQSDLNVVTDSPAEVDSTDFSTIVDTNAAHDGTGSTANTFGTVVAVPGYAGYSDGKPGGATGIGGAGAAVAGNFVVYYLTGGVWTQSTGWTMVATTDAVGTPPSHNYITLTNPDAPLPATHGMAIKVVFFGTDTNYIQNPGAGNFFVRMNTYSGLDTSGTGDTDESGSIDGAETPLIVNGADAATLIDGGVTVANVMNQSIWIQTKVLETMEFSVGTVDPNTLDSSDGTDGGVTVADNRASTFEKAMFAGATTDGSTYKGDIPHSICNQIVGNITPLQPTNVLKLGKQDSESSLETNHTYSTHSYWRLSSNSSAGATVYYSGHTLTNTVGDEITAIGKDKTSPTPGSEQFGLALDNTPAGSPTSVADLKVDYTQERSAGAEYENGNDNYNYATPTTGPITRGLHPSTVSDVTGNASWHDPTLYPLVPADNYSSGAGGINTATSTQFAFVPTSDTIPEPLASESSQVVDCVTGKMRYIANIAAITPAGIYTTKVNYIAAPQY